MGDPKTTLWQELGQGIGKIMVWLAYILIGVMAKLAFDSRVQKLTNKQIIIKTALSVFAGFISAEICEATGFTKWEKVIVPVSTLIGEGLTGYIIFNWNKIAAKLLPGWFAEPQSKNKSSL